MINYKTAISIQVYTDIESDLEHINLDNVLTCEADAFRGCFSIELNVPGQWQTIRQRCFGYAHKLERLTIGEGIEVIETEAFRQLLVKEVDLPSSLVRIEYQAFLGSALESLILPERIEYIGKEAFGQSAIKGNISIPGSCGVVDARAFYDCGGIESAVAENCATYLGPDVFRGVAKKFQYICVQTKPFTQYGLFLRQNYHERQLKLLGFLSVGLLDYVCLEH